MFRIETEVDKQRVDLLRSRLGETNAEESAAIRVLRGTPAERELPLQAWALDQDGALIGGCDAHTWARWLHVNLLWVDARYRGTGLGTRLLADVERRARDEGDCVSARVSTWDFQAPGFYRSLGYEAVAVIPDYPPGVTEFTLVKRLG
ncbi:GNAT family N-acetyltransferase [Streptomyces sp. NPDC091292]|uniref:GNAT family N-acetyltransferase n=1 Tax=Streptomyces sp. NPDC091292 TaxID=3365991 RepID=UPI003802D4C3